MSSIKSKAYRGAAWQFASLTFSASINIVYVSVMARLLTKTDYGQFGLACVVTGITQIFAQFGFGPALIQKKEANQEDINYVFLTTVGIGAVLCLALAAVAYPISHFFEGKVSPRMIQAMSLGMVFSTAGLTSRSLLMRDFEFDKIFWGNSLSYLFGNFVTGITLAWLGYGVWSLIIGVLASQFLASAMFLLMRPPRVSWKFDRRASRGLTAYGIGLTGVQLFHQLAQQIDRVILGKLVSVNMLGVYERSLKIQSMPLLYAGSTLDGVLFSATSKIAEQRKKLGEFFFSFLVLMAIGTLYASVITYFFAEQIIGLLLGQNFVDAVPVLQWLAILIFVQTFSRFGDTLIRATNEFPRSLRVKIVFLVVMVGGTWIGSLAAGFPGAVFGIVASHCLHSLLMAKVCIDITEYSFGHLYALMLPVMALGAMLVAKNVLVFSLLSPFLPRVVAVAVTDAMLLGIYFAFPSLIGRQNAAFIRARLSDAHVAGRLRQFTEPLLRSLRRNVK